MIRGGLGLECWTTLVIALAVAASVIRLLLWRRSAAVETRTPPRRLALLIALQLAAGLLLHLVLFPPGVITRMGALIVATAGAPQSIARGPLDILVALPEAEAVQEAVRMPDLATALRRFPGASKIRLVGAGLEPRDQAPTPIPLDYDPPPRPRGLVELAFPEPVAPGGTFVVGGMVGALAKGTVELVDPAEVVVDRVGVAAGQRFAVGSHTRAPGLALFTLRLRDPAGVVVEQVAAPVETRVQRPPRVLVLAGAPGPETKHLRRWAEDAGIDLDVDLELGGGLRLADAPVQLTRSALGEIDLLVIDDRRWETLDGGARAALASAVDGGLGLLLQPTGPLTAATRRDWAALGVPLTGSADSRPLRLPPTPSVPAPGSGTTEKPAEVLPELSRLDVAHEGSRAISFLRGADGVALASWRARGVGRVGVWTVTDSYALVLTGRPDRYGELWSELFSALARPGEDSRARVEDFARAGARIAVCREAQARVVAPDGKEQLLRVDPSSGGQACAAYWPEQSGWHVVRDGEARETPFYVHPAEAAPSLAAAARRQATLDLAAIQPNARAPWTQRGRGSPWPWFALLLVALASLWWLERNRGVAARPGPVQPWR